MGGADRVMGGLDAQEPLRGLGDLYQQGGSQRPGPVSVTERPVNVCLGRPRWVWFVYSSGLSGLDGSPGPGAESCPPEPPPCPVCMPLDATLRVGGHPRPLTKL